MTTAATTEAAPQLAPAKPGARTHEFTPSEFVDHCLDSLRTEFEPKLADLRRRCADAAHASAAKGADAVRAAVNAVVLEAPTTTTPTRGYVGRVRLIGGREMKLDLECGPLRPGQHLWFSALREVVRPRSKGVALEIESFDSGSGAVMFTELVTSVVPDIAPWDYAFVGEYRP